MLHTAYIKGIYNTTYELHINYIHFPYIINVLDMNYIQITYRNSCYMWCTYKLYTKRHMNFIQEYTAFIQFTYATFDWHCGCPPCLSLSTWTGWSCIWWSISFTEHAWISLLPQVFAMKFMKLDEAAGAGPGWSKRGAWERGEGGSGASSPGSSWGILSRPSRLLIIRINKGWSLRIQRSKLHMFHMCQM